MTRFDDFKKLFCDKCDRVQPVYTYCLHYYCQKCKTLLGFFPFSREAQVPCKWNNEGTELIKLVPDDTTVSKS